MRAESIDLGHADDGLRTQLHESISAEDLGESIYLERPPFSDSSADSESVVWRPRLGEWLVLICVSFVAMLDAFDATMLVPIIPVCLLEFGPRSVLTCSLLFAGPVSCVRTTASDRSLGGHVVSRRQGSKSANLRHAV